MIRKNIGKILLAVFLLIIITGCSKTTPTGEMVQAEEKAWKL